MPQFTVEGVDRESQLETDLVIDASTKEAAKVKAELKGMVVTKVTGGPSGAVRLLPEATTDEGKIAMGVARGAFWVAAIAVIWFLLMAIASAYSG
jgi:hypothetical protein